MLRFLCIIQLCIAFCLFLSTLCYPFFGSYFEDRKKLLILETALGDISGIAWKSATLSEKELLIRNQELAKTLSPSEKEPLQKIKNSLLKKMEKRTFFSDAENALFLLFHNPYFFLYMTFSVLVPLLLLLEHPLKKESIIFLPLLALCFIGDNVFYAKPPKDSEKKLFPKEQEVLSTYTRYYGAIPLTKSQGLDVYIIDTYLKEKPSKNLEEFQKQKERALYRFTVERALLQTADAEHFKERKPTGILLIFFLWNILFALLSYNYRDTAIRRDFS